MGWRSTLASLRRRSGAAAVAEPLERARAAAAAKEWEAAAEGWREVLQLVDPDELGAEPWAELARAQRLSRALDDAARTVDEGLNSFPDDVSIAVENARLALRAYAASAEDERHRWKSRLLDADRDLRRARERGQVTKPALQAAGEIALVLRRWDEAVLLWRQLEDRYPDRSDLAVLKQATALRSAGELSAARTVLDRASAEAAAGREVRALDRAIATAERVAAANEAYAAASERWHAGERGVLVAELPAAIADRGHPPERVERLLPLLEELSRFVDAAAGSEVVAPSQSVDGPEAGIGEARRTVLVSGFLYSGSGAVFDFLRQHARFHLPFEDKETGFLKKPGHLATILEADGGSRFPDAAAVADAVLASTVGFGQSGRPLLGWAAPDDAKVDRLTAQLRWLVAELGRVWAELGHDAAAAEAPVAAALRGFLDAVIADRTPPDRAALLNNAIVGHQLERMDLLSRSVAIPVIRDPRDQYVSQKLESPYAMACEDFVVMMSQRYAALEALRSHETLSTRILPVCFERFVRDEGTRRELLDRLEVAATDAAAVARTFHPARSERNIGIHRDHPDQDEIDHIGSRLLPTFEALTGSL